jgi:acyl-CoA thioesterase-2
MRERILVQRPFELRPTDPSENPFAPTPRPPRRALWLRADARLPDDPALHAYLLAYVSDFSFVSTALLPHGVSWVATPGMQLASLDHIMWFHRPFRVDEWLLYDIQSPSAGGSRGLVHGRIFTEDGRLVASTAQEGLMRQRAHPQAG